jgi:phosphosulfolactate synthase
MSGQVNTNIWLEMLRFPLQGRSQKPRQQGLTMVIDKGLGLGGLKDLLMTAGDYIDFIKLGFGTPALYSGTLLEEKISLTKSFGVDIYPGGTFLEIAVLQNKLLEYIRTAGRIGFTAIEVSDGTIEMSPEVRASAISEARNLGLKVLTEVGKKIPGNKVSVAGYIEQIKQDLAQGACQVIVEGRESGKNAGIYDSEGKFIQNEMEELLEAVGCSRLLWEAPLKNQQQELILSFGPNVNLGNIPPPGVVAVHALGVGGGGDPVYPVYKSQSSS